MFIVVDGIDGSGKSEIIKMLHSYLFSKNKKYSILTTREPTNSPYGKKIRQILMEGKNPESNSEKLTELFLKDRQDHLKNEIEPFLGGLDETDSKIVLCDRYYYSTISFQGAQGFDMGQLIEKNKSFRKPNITFILDVKPSLAIERIKNRPPEKFEHVDFMEKIRKNFLKLPKLLNDNIKIIDSSKSLNKVFEDVKGEVDKIIP